MKLSRRMYRQIEIKIRQAMANDMVHRETVALPEPASRAKPSAEGTTER